MTALATSRNFSTPGVECNAKMNCVICTLRNEYFVIGLLARCTRETELIDSYTVMQTKVHSSSQDCVLRREQQLPRLTDPSISQRSISDVYNPMASVDVSTPQTSPRFLVRSYSKNYPPIKTSDNSTALPTCLVRV